MLSERERISAAGACSSGADERGITGPGISCEPSRFGTMKKLFELLVCFLHPIAVVLVWLDLAADRPDLGRGGKLAWGIFALIPLVPFLYVLTGGDLW